MAMRYQSSNEHVHCNHLSLSSTCLPFPTANYILQKTCTIVQHSTPGYAFYRNVRKQPQNRNAVAVLINSFYRNVRKLPENHDAVAILIYVTMNPNQRAWYQKKAPINYTPRALLKTNTSSRCTKYIYIDIFNLKLTAMHFNVKVFK